MYDQSVKSQGIAADVRKALFAEFFNRFQALNDEQQKLISAIEDKAHDLLNKRVPSDNAKQEGPHITDFMGNIADQADRLSVANRRLEAILSHLSEII